VDNAPPDDRTREAAERAGVRYAREPVPGLDVARNRALAEARGEWLAFLDDDVVADPGWLGGLYEALAVHPDAAAVTGAVLPLALETEAQVLFERAGGFRRGFRPYRYHGSTLPGNPLYPTGPGIFGAGANMAFRREVLLALGGFDEALDTGPPLPGGGDLDVFYRVVRSGAPLVYWPAALVFHEHRRSLAALRRQYHSWGTGFMAFLTKGYRTDPPQRRKLRRMVAWWVGYQLRRLHGSVRGRTALPTAMVLAELWGGVQGLAGEYGRSERRVARLRQRYPRAEAARHDRPPVVAVP
jgi:glycosyltransferase involved in cell wall biosynthesis